MEMKWNSESGARWLLAGILVLAAAVRVVAARGDLWLDEIWAMYLAADVKSVWDIFTRLQQDTNQHLCTLYFYLVGEVPHPLLYRLPSLAAGVAGIALARRVVIGRRGGETLTWAWLMALSFPMILYSSEARGYALAVFFALAAFAVFRAGGPAPAFWLSVVLGFLSHLTFAQVYLALLAGSLARPLLRREPLARGLAAAVRWHAVPLLFLAGFYAVGLRHFTFGKGPLTEVQWSVFDALTQACGLPPRGLAAVAGGAAAIVLAGIGIAKLFEERDDAWFFLLCVALFAPALLRLVRPSPYAVARHFVVCVPFLYLLLAWILARAWGWGWGGKALGVVVMAGFTLGSAVRTGHLLAEGRGQYRQAVLFMAEQTAGEAVGVGTDHDFRNKMLLHYYGRYVVPLGKKIVYYDQGSWPAGGPEWLIAHSLDPACEPLPVLVHKTGALYRLQRSYPCRGPSGWSWFVYRKAAAR